MSGFSFDNRRGYCIVRFESTLLDMSWGDVESGAAEISEKLRAADTGNVIVDLTPMELIQSDLVASMLRMWKSTDHHSKRQLVVAAPSDVVKEVLRSAGLFKVFSVVHSLDDASTEIGAAKLEQRHKQGPSSGGSRSSWAIAVVMLLVGVAVGAAAMYFANSGGGQNDEAGLSPIGYGNINNEGSEEADESETSDDAVSSESSILDKTGELTVRGNKPEPDNDDDNDDGVIEADIEAPDTDSEDN
ncbi:MAG: hypothetical protein MK110_05190 [Fuerstiella sp.]|nr:hypothetical protein [Fuerstiella sp.]